MTALHAVLGDWPRTDRSITRAGHLTSGPTQPLASGVLEEAVVGSHNVQLGPQEERP